MLTNWFQILLKNSFIIALRFASQATLKENIFSFKLMLSVTIRNHKYYNESRFIFWYI